MARYAVISDGIVENVIEADASFSLPGKTLIQSDTAGPGDTYKGGKFTKTPLVRKVKEPTDTEILLSALEAKVGITDADKQAAVDRLKGG